MVKNRGTAARGTGFESCLGHFCLWTGVLALLTVSSLVKWGDLHPVLNVSSLVTWANLQSQPPGVVPVV